MRCLRAPPPATCRRFCATAAYTLPCAPSAVLRWRRSSCAVRHCGFYGMSRLHARCTAHTAVCHALKTLVPCGRTLPSVSATRDTTLPSLYDTGSAIPSGTVRVDSDAAVQGSIPSHCACGACASLASGILLAAHRRARHHAQPGTSPGAPDVGIITNLLPSFSAGHGTCCGT